MWLNRYCFSHTDSRADMHRTVSIPQLMRRFMAITARKIHTGNATMQYLGVLPSAHAGM